MATKPIKFAAHLVAIAFLGLAVALFGRGVLGPPVHYGVALLFIYATICLLGISMIAGLVALLREEQYAWITVLVAAFLFASIFVFG